MAEAFGKIKSSFNRSIATISVKTSSSLEKSKLKTHIESLNNEIQKQYYQIGELAYNTWLNEHTDYSQLIRLFEEVKANQAMISELSTQLNSIDHRDSQILGKVEKPADANYICPNCGTGFENPVKFCRCCGTKMAE